MNFEDISKGNILVGFVPNRLEIKGRPELNLFPFNILFEGHKTDGEKIVIATAVYEPDTSSFKSKKGMLSLKYYNIYGESWVVIEYNLSTKYYTGTKYIKGEPAAKAMGMEWESFFSHFTELGLSDFERCKFEVFTPEESLN